MIYLTEKDADWIANIARSQLQTLLNTKEDIEKSRKEILNLAESFRTEKDEKDYQEILELDKEVSKECESSFLEEKSKLEKIIELMTLGSEK